MSKWNLPSGVEPDAPTRDDAHQELCQCKSCQANYGLPTPQPDAPCPKCGGSTLLGAGVFCVKCDTQPDAVERAKEWMRHEGYSGGRISADAALVARATAAERKRLCALAGSYMDYHTQDGWVRALGLLAALRKGD